MSLRPDDYISCIKNADLRLIAGVLDKDQGWKRIVEYLGIFNESTFSYCQSPAEKLLWELNSKLGTVQMLCDILLSCELYDALSVIRKERMSVTKQPTDGLDNNEIFVQRGDKLHLEFKVWGLPQPKYTWYKNDADLEQHSSTLNHKNFSIDQQGEYYCVATQVLEHGEQDVLQSSVVHVRVLPERCVLLSKPQKELFVIAGNSITLEVQVDGYPVPKYQWMFDNTVLKNITTNKLTVQKSSKKYEGIYRCVISNEVNEIAVRTKVTVLDSAGMFPECREPVVEKVALLIGNKDYEHQSDLSTPEDDVASLATMLYSKGFVVIALVNCTLEEMKRALRDFCSLLLEGAYALFYYAGHGFELGDKFLLPTDAPGPEHFGLKHCVSECQVLRDVLDTRPQLFLLLMDMCLKLPDRAQNPAIYEERREVFEFRPDRNLVQGYSTTSSLGSYEPSNRRFSLYNAAFKKYLAQDLPVLKLLARVSHELQTVTRDQVIKQIPSVSFNVVQDYYLSAPKRGGGGTRGGHQR